MFILEFLIQNENPFFGFKIACVFNKQANDLGSIQLQFSTIDNCKKHVYIFNILTRILSMSTIFFCNDNTILYGFETLCNLKNSGINVAERD